MSRCALLLRGVNVGGKNLVPMAKLRALAESLGCADAVTLLQSGNLVFTAPAGRPEALESRFESALAATLKVNSECHVRTVREWAALVAANPFTAEAKADPAHLHAVLLRGSPAAKQVAALRAAFAGPERLAAVGRTLYVVYPAGSGNSKLTLPLMEKHLATSGTARNWNTVTKIAALLAA